MVSSPCIGLLLLICMLKAGETLPAGSQLRGASFPMVGRWIARVVRPDAEDLGAFGGLFLLLPIDARLGLKPL